VGVNIFKVLDISFWMATLYCLAPIKPYYIGAPWRSWVQVFYGPLAYKLEQIMSELSSGRRRTLLSNGIKRTRDHRAEMTKGNIDPHTINSINPATIMPHLILRFSQYLIYYILIYML